MVSGVPINTLLGNAAGTASTTLQLVQQILSRLPEGSRTQVQVVGNTPQGQAIIQLTSPQGTLELPLQNQLPTPLPRGSQLELEVLLNTLTVGTNNQAKGDTPSSAKQPEIPQLLTQIVRVNDQPALPKNVESGVQFLATRANTPAPQQIQTPSANSANNAPLIVTPRGTVVNVAAPDVARIVLPPQLANIAGKAIPATVPQPVTATASQPAVQVAQNSLLQATNASTSVPLQARILTPNTATLPNYIAPSVVPQPAVTIVNVSAQTVQQPAVPTAATPTTQPPVTTPAIPSAPAAPAAAPAAAPVIATLTSGQTITVQLHEITLPQQVSTPAAVQTSTATSTSTAPAVTAPQTTFPATPQQFTPAGAPLIPAVVTASTPNQNITLQTAIGTVVVQSKEALPVGTQLQLEVTQITPRPAAIPLNNAAIPVLSTQLVDTLQDIVQVIQQAFPAPQAQALTGQLLPTDNKQFIAKSLWFVAGLQMADANAWMGPEIRRALEQNGRTELIDKLQNLFNIAKSGMQAQAQPTAQGSAWQPYLLPFYDGAQVQMAHAYVKRDLEDGSQKQKKQKENARFIVEVEMSVFGPVQLDGFMRWPEASAENEARPAPQFQLMLKTKKPLPQEVAGELTTLFTDTLAAHGLQGAMQMQVTEQFTQEHKQQHDAMNSIIA